MAREVLDAQLERRHDEALMPMTMGSPLRVPHYAYGAWDLHLHQNESLAEKAYKAEWEAGNAGQLGLVSRATIEAGFGDFPELLRRETAKTVTALLKDRKDDQELRILDIGAGPGLSALAVYNALPSRLKSKTTMFLVDPSVESLKAATQRMKDNGINFRILTGTDSETLKSINPGAIDVLTGVASVHHHAKIPFEKYQGVLKEGGFAVFGDWHQSIWEHPGNVLKFLERFDWPKKKEGLRNFLEAYPQARNAPPPPKSPEDKKAIEQITQFWLACKRIADASNLGLNAIWPLEGHRPVAKYIEGMKEAGFSTDFLGIRKATIRNLQQILPDSSLLQVTVGQKLLRI